MLLRHPLRPVLKLLPRPLEPVIGVPELAGRQRLPHHVVFPVRRRQHDRLRPGELEQNSLQGRQPRRIEMLDDFNNRGRIESGPAVCRDRSATRESAQSVRRCMGGQPLVTQPLHRSLRAPAPTRPCRRSRSNCRSASSSRSSFPSPQPRSRTLRAPLPRSAASTAPCRCSFRLRGFSSDSSWLSRVRTSSTASPSSSSNEPGKRFTEQARLVLQISAGDLLLLGMRCEPARSFGQQLLQFVLADEVVLLVVEDRNEHVEVRQQFGQRFRAADRGRVIRTLAPLGKPFIERMPDRPRPCSPAARTSAAESPRRRAPAGRRCRAVSGIGVATSSGRSLQRPPMAVPNTCEIATLMNDEAT